MTQKEQIVKAIQDLPETATFDEAIERLYVLLKIQRAQDQARAGEGKPQEEIERRYLGEAHPVDAGSGG